MPMPIGPIIGILADNLRLRRSVLPLSKSRATGWAKGLGLPRGGETVLYTGLMYQMMPSVVRMAKQMERLEGTWVARAMHLGRKVNRLLNTSRFMPAPSKEEQAAFDTRLRNIARLLQAAGVEFGYLYEQEMYAGALVCDLGVDEVFRPHARRVYDMLKRNGVRRVITVDPHTTDILRTVFPKLIPEYDIEVRSYLEILVEHGLTGKHPLEQDIVVHDSCVYARYENVVDEPRALLAAAGAALCEQDDAGKLTHCCGGPIEGLYPDKARAIAEKRLAQLLKSGSRNVAAMCPICLVNLQQACNGSGANVRDISEYLVEACCDADK